MMLVLFSAWVSRAPLSRTNRAQPSGSHPVATSILRRRRSQKGRRRQSDPLCVTSTPSHPPCRSGDSTPSAPYQSPHSSKAPRPAIHTYSSTFSGSSPFRVLIRSLNFTPGSLSSLEKGGRMASRIRPFFFTVAFRGVPCGAVPCPCRCCTPPGFPASWELARSDRVLRGWAFFFFLHRLRARRIISVCVLLV